MSESLKRLYDLLERDNTRVDRAFRVDMQLASSVILHAYARPDEQAAALSLWLQQKNQPCLFGRIAAKAEGIGFCFLTDRDILESDDHVERKIHDARMLWKRRAMRGRPIHGFMLVVASERVMYAAPDDALKRFCVRVRELCGWQTVPDEVGNDITTETLYLQNPKDKGYSKFTFTVDFFAAAGDGRWWHDHRVPSGIAFTANSLGHMVRTQEWCKGNDDQIPWALRTAMLTIQTAAETQHGKATWLLGSVNEELFKTVQWPDAKPPSEVERLRCKDWSAYAGYLHTDHSIRNEFFTSDEVPPTKDRPWAMDFSYIYDQTTVDYTSFMAGEPVSEDEVFAEIGKPGDWRFITTDELDRPADATAELMVSLAKCEEWRLSDSELLSILKR